VRHCSHCCVQSRLVNSKNDSFLRMCIKGSDLIDISGGKSEAGICKKRLGAVSTVQGVESPTLVSLC
jgi:hypothetical protein